MRRRDFIKVLAGADVLWPVVVRAQQSDRMRRIGVLLGGLAADDPEAQRGLAALRQGLAALGRIEGRDLQIDYRSGVGDTERSRKFAAELVAAVCTGPNFSIAVRKFAKCVGSVGTLSAISSLCGKSPGDRAQILFN